MDESIEEDRLGVQQDIQQIHKLLGERYDAEEEEASETSASEMEDDPPEAVDAQFEGYQPGAPAPLQSQSRDVPSTSGYADPVATPTIAVEASAENLLQINLSYQDALCTVLEQIKAARAKNHAIQKSVSTSVSKGTKCGMQRHKHYFTGKSSSMAGPTNEEAQKIRAHKAPSPYTPNPKAWSEEEDRLLYEGVRNDGLQRIMQPLMAKQEHLYNKRCDADDDEKKALTKELNDVIGKLEEMKQCVKMMELLGDRMRPVDWMKIASLHLNGDRSAIECQLRWQNEIHPSIERSKWTDDEESRLDKLVETFRGRNWQDISKKLGTGRAPFDCFSKYQQKEIIAYTRRPFTAEEDELIPELVQRFQTGSYIHFNKVAYFMDQRMTAQIAKHWEAKLNPNAKIGSWTQEEDELLLKGLQIHGMKWCRLAEMVKGRRANQIRDRYMYTLNPANKKGSYTLEEDLIILESIKEFGVGCWVDISKKFHRLTGSYRTPNSVLHRFNGMFNRFFKKVKGISLKDGDSLEVLNDMPLDTLLDDMIENRKNRGERKIRTNQKYYKALYKRKKPFKEPPVKKRIHKNAKQSTKNIVYSDMTNEMVATIQPVGWLMPKRGLWKAAWGSIVMRKDAYSKLSFLIQKVLAISDEGRDLFFQSIVSRARKDEREVEQHLPAQSTGDQSQELPDAAGDPAEDLPSVAKTTENVTPQETPALPLPSQQPGMHPPVGSPGGAIITQIFSRPDQSNFMSSPIDPRRHDNTITVKELLVDPKKTTDTLESKESKKSKKIKKSKKTEKTKDIKPIHLNLRQSSVFGQGTFQVPGKGFLVPVQNYVTQFGQTIPQPRHRPIAPKGGIRFGQSFQPYSFPISSPQQPLHVMYGNQLAAPIGQPQMGVQVPGQGFVMQYGQIKQEPIAPPPPALLPIAQNTHAHQPQNSAIPVLPGNTPSSAGPGAQSVDQFQKIQMSSITGRDAHASAPSEDVVRVTVIENSGSVSIHVEERPESVTSKDSENCEVSTAKDIGPADSRPQGPTGDGKQHSVDDVVCEDHPSTSTDAANVQGNDEQQSGNDICQEDIDEGDAILPPLPPNEATVAAFMQILLQRRRLETKAKELRTFKSYMSRKRDENSKGTFQRSKGPQEELTNQQKVSTLSSANASNQPSCSGANQSLSEVKSETAGDKSMPNTSEETQDKKPTNLKAKKRSSFWTFTRTSEQYTEALENIRDSEWYHVLKERFLSMFLWPALLSIVGPHKEKSKRGRAKKSENKEHIPESYETKASENLEGEDTRPASSGKPIPGRGRKKKKPRLSKVKEQPNKNKADEGDEVKPKRTKKAKSYSSVPSGMAKRTRGALQLKECHNALEMMETMPPVSAVNQNECETNSPHPAPDGDLPNQQELRLPSGEGHAQGQVTNGSQGSNMDTSQMASKDSRDLTELNSKKVSDKDNTDESNEDDATPSMPRVDGNGVSVLHESEARAASSTAFNTEDTLSVDQQKAPSNGSSSVQQGSCDTVEDEESNAAEESNRSSLPVKKRAKADFDFKVALKQRTGSPRGKKRTLGGGDANGRSPKKVRMVMDSEEINA